MSLLALILSLLSIMFTCIALYKINKLEEEIEEQIAINTSFSERLNNLNHSTSKRPY